MRLLIVHSDFINKLKVHIEIDDRKEGHISFSLIYKILRAIVGLFFANVFY